MTSELFHSAKQSPSEAIVEWWQRAAIAAMIASTVALGATGFVDICSGSGSLLFSVAWLILPPITIAAVAVVAVASPEAWERWVSGAVATGLVLLWSYGVVWASVAEVISKPMC